MAFTFLLLIAEEIKLKFHLFIRSTIITLVQHLQLQKCMLKLAQ